MEENITLVDNEVVIESKQDATEYINSRLAMIQDYRNEMNIYQNKIDTIMAQLQSLI